MPGAYARRCLFALLLVVDSALLASLVLSSSVPSSMSGVRYLASGESPASTTSAPAVGVSVNPPSFWMRTGENVTFEAVWSTDSALCPVSVLWFAWTVDEANATGFLNASTGPSVTFWADSFDSGTVAVDVRSAAVLECGSNDTVVERSNRTDVSIVVPLALSTIALGPNPLPADGVVTVGANVTGGAPPYTVDVVWDDGTSTELRMARPGEFLANHTYASGEFVPYVLVSDSESDVENRSAEEAVSVGSGFRVAVDPSNFVAEVGIPTEFTGVEADAPNDSVALDDCTDASSTPTPRATSFVNGTAFSCTFESAGTDEVLFGLYAPYPGGPSATAILYETVVDPPALLTTPLSNVGEVGDDALVAVTLSGGDLPIALEWNLSGNRSAGSSLADSDGIGMLALPLVAAGEYALGIRAVDGFGAAATNGTFPLEVYPMLAASADSARSTGSDGVDIQLLTTVVFGCPAFSWWVVPEFPAANSSASNGSLSAVGAFRWNGSYLAEGSATFTVLVVDACGGSWTKLFVDDLLPPLVADVSVEPESALPNSTVAVTVKVQGGWAPYRLFANTSVNTSWNRTVPSAGTTRFTWATGANGTLALNFTLVDDLGDSVETHLTVVFPTAPPGPTPTPPPPGTLDLPNSTASSSSIDAVELLGSFALPAGLGVVLVILWRRRQRKSRRPPAQPDPVAVLKRIIEPADGAERFTVELLAEEEGIPLSMVRSTIDRLVAQGTVRSESGADGEEVLSWSGTPDP